MIGNKNRRRARIRPPSDPARGPGDCSYIDEDDCRLLVGDLAGNYTLVQVTKGPTGPAVVKPFFLGNTTPCTTLTYLDGGYAYLGSRFGDSALIRLLEEPDSNGSNIELVTTYRNLGPIVDLAVLDASGNDAGMGSQIVTCSGAYSSGSLRVVRHGIEIKPIDVVELPAATRIVTCTAPVIGGSLAAISIGNVQSVLVHVKDDGEVDIVEETGLATDVATIALGQVGDAIAQASHSGIRLFANVDGGATNTLTPLSTANAGSSGNWSAPDMAQIVDVCFADSLALVALARSVCVVSLEA
ncbi:mono-functional DNA-alkylating methyl methanesulfonate N-term-domain-containing protein, partial [Blastocladiella britannica]